MGLKVLRSIPVNGNLQIIKILIGSFIGEAELHIYSNVLLPLAGREFYSDKKVHFA